MLAISNSEVQCFKNCRREWWLTYWRRLERDWAELTGPRTLGNLLHECLDVYYSSGQDQGLATAHAHARLDETLAKWPESAKEIRAEFDLALLMLEGYFEWLGEEGEDAELEVIGVELGVRTESPHPAFELLGKMDLLVRQRGFVGPMDHKTTGSLTDPLKTVHMMEQGLWYQLQSRLLQQDEPVTGMLYNYLKRSKRTARAKPPFYNRHRVHHNDTELDAFWRKLFGVLQAMHEVRARLEAGEDPMVVCYPTPSQTCSWKCDFYRVCPMFDDARTDVEGQLADQYREHDPYARYGAHLPEGQE